MSLKAPWALKFKCGSLKVVETKIEKECLHYMIVVTFGTDLSTRIHSKHRLKKESWKVMSFYDLKGELTKQKCALNGIPTNENPGILQKHFYEWELARQLGGSQCHSLK